MYKNNIKVFQAFEPPKEKKKKSKFCNYFRFLCKQSLITGIPAIVTTKSIIGKIVKSIVFLICTTGFLYQTSDFLRMYFAYPTMVDVQLITPEYIDLPAVSICPANNLKRRSICTNYPEKCMIFHNDWKNFCESRPTFCDGRFSYKQELKELSGKGLINDWGYQELNGFKQEDIIDTCILIMPTEEIPCRNFRKIPVLRPGYEDPNFCYAVESLWGRVNQTAKRIPTTTVLSLKISLMPEEFLETRFLPRVNVHVHDPRTVGNAMTEGMSFEGGKKYLVYINQIRKELLPPPYRSNCRNYMKEWTENDGIWPLNRQMCISKCRIDTSLKKGICINSKIIYPHQYNICDTNSNDVQSSSMVTSLSPDEMTYCYESCEEACEENSYPMTAEHIEEAKQCDKGLKKCQIEMISLDIHFQRIEQTVFKHQPKYESVEMFSYIGGYMGMWLGISLVALFDFLDAMAHLVCYPMMTSRRKKALKKHFQEDYPIPRPIYEHHDPYRERLY